MKKKCLKIALGAALFFGLGISTPVFAAVLSSQTDISSSASMSGETRVGIGDNLSGDLHSLKIKLSPNRTDLNVALYKTIDNDDLADGISPPGGYGQVDDFNFQDIITNGDGYATITTTGSDHSFIAGKAYWIDIYSDTGTPFDIYGSPDILDSNHRIYASGWVVQETPKQGYFEAYDSGGAPPPQSIEITSPADQSELPQFYNWGVTYSAAFGPGLTYGVEIYYADSPGVTNEVYDYRDVVGSLLGGDNETADVMKGHLLDLGDWYARAYLLDSDNDVIATSGEIVLTIIAIPPDSGSEVYEPPPEVECGSTDFACKIWSWFANGIGGILNYLFSPSAASLNRWQELWPDISNRVPFGYFNLAKDSLNSITEGDGAFTLPEIPALSFIKTGISAALWVVLGLYFVRRIGNMKI